MKIMSRTRVGVIHLSISTMEAGGVVGGVGIAGLTIEAVGNSNVISGKGIIVAVPVIGIDRVPVRIPPGGCS
jgi:hypothetical protein